MLDSLMAFSHVLITRPGPEAAELAQWLRGTPQKPIMMPAFRFEPGFPGLDFGRAWHSNRQAGNRRMVIFCSPRAVEFGLRQLPAGFLDSVEIAAIGPATANFLESAGHAVSMLPAKAFNSESLLQHPSLASKPGQALIFSAPGGRQRLFSGLEQLGWRTHFAHVYQAIPLAPDQAAVKAILEAMTLLSIWTSANSLEQLSGSIESGAWEKVLQGEFLVSSDRLGKIARRYTAGQIHVTDGPGNEALMAAILSLQA